MVSTYIAQDGMTPDDAAAEVDRRQPGQGGRLAQVSSTGRRARSHRAPRRPVPVTLDGHGASRLTLGRVPHSAIALRHTQQGDDGTWPPFPPPPASSSSAPASSATASSTTSPGSAGATSCSSTRARCPNPGGSTGHASNFIFPVDHSREITDLTLDSVRQYQEMGVFTESGGFELARTEERMEELRRRMSSARAWGIEAELVSPDVREGEGPVHRDRPVHRGVLDPERGRGRLAAGRHDHARARPGDRRADRRTRRWRWSASTPRRTGSAAAGSPGSGPRTATSRPRPWSSPAACGAPRSATWPGSRSR